MVDNTQDDAAAFGIALPEQAPEDNFEVWEENWPAIELFMRVQTQWRTTMNGVLGLDYGAVAWLLKLYEVSDPRALLEDLQIMESAVIMVLNDFHQRRSAWAIMDEIKAKLADLSGVKAFPVMRQGFGARIQKPVQFVLGGGTYEELAQWRDTLLAEIEKDNPGLTSIDWDYKETKPQLRVEIDYDRAADLGVTVGDVRTPFGESASAAGVTAANATTLEATIGVTPAAEARMIASATAGATP